MFYLKETLQVLTKSTTQSDPPYQTFVSIRCQSIPSKLYPSITNRCWMPYQNRLSFLKILASSQRACKEKKGNIKTKTNRKRQKEQKGKNRKRGKRKNERKEIKTNRKRKDKKKKKKI